MKVNQLKTIIKQAVKEAIQEEMKDILLEAIKTPKTQIQENTPVKQKPLDKKDKIGLSVAVPSAIGMSAAIFKKLKEYDKKGKEYMNPSRKPQTLKDG